MVLSNKVDLYPQLCYLADFESLGYSQYCFLQKSLANMATNLGILINNE